MEFSLWKCSEPLSALSSGLGQRCALAWTLSLSLAQEPVRPSGEGRPQNFFSGISFAFVFLPTNLRLGCHFLCLGPSGHQLPLDVCGCPLVECCACELCGCSTLRVPSDLGLIRLLSVPCLSRTCLCPPSGSKKKALCQGGEGAGQRALPQKHGQTGKGPPSLGPSLAGGPGMRRQSASVRGGSPSPLWTSLASPCH